MNEAERSEGRFEEALREWGSRPPNTTPAVAARRVVGQLPRERELVRSWHPLLAGAALLLFVVAAWLLIPSSPPGDGALVAQGLPPAVDENVVVWWLDADTPVYFALPSGSGSTGGES